MVTIDSDWIRERIEAGHCAVTGLPFDLSQVGRPPAPLTPSLDQIRPGEGYTPENTQVVVWIYNRAKGADTHEAVMQLADALCRK